MSSKVPVKNSKLRNILHNKIHLIAAMGSFERALTVLRLPAPMGVTYVWHTNPCESRFGFSKGVSWIGDSPSPLRKRTFSFFLLALTICIHNAGLSIQASSHSLSLSFRRLIYMSAFRLEARKYSYDLRERKHSTCIR